MNLNASTSPFHMEQILDQDHDLPHLQPFVPNNLVDSSSSSVSCRTFFNSTQDHTGYYNPLYQPKHHDQEDDNYACYGGSSYEIKNKVENSGLKLTLWKKDEDHDPKAVAQENNQLQKMKNKPDRLTLKITSSATVNKLEDQNNSDLSSCSSSYNINSPIRVCSDCNTTKTPLWRSGPKGPKSLCNACGIRQRKARRAAAAAANGAAVASHQPPTVKIKVQHKQKNSAGKNGHGGKRCKINAGAASSSTTTNLNKRQKLGFEDFLINLNNKFAFHRVFPEEEKDAAILLMALSSGLVHG